MFPNRIRSVMAAHGGDGAWTVCSRSRRWEMQYLHTPSMCDIHAVDLDCFAIRDKISSQSYRVCWITKAMTPCIADTGAQRSTNAPHIYIYILFSIDPLLQKDCFTISERISTFIGRKWSSAITKIRSKSLAVWLWRTSHRRNLHT